MRLCAQERFISVLEDMLLARPGGHDRRRRVASDNAHHDQAMFHDNDDEAMPFELRVLETALSEVRPKLLQGRCGLPSIRLSPILIACSNKE
eukprot:353547-Chlamydomonas_euryale.AAC.11